MSVKPVEVTVVLKKSRREAFDAFTAQVSKWWPLETHSVGPYLGEPAPDAVVIEPHEGGRIFEVSPKGVERIWATITTWVRDEELAFTWHPGKEEALATSVHVSFKSTDAGDTAVTLIHTGWDVLGGEAQATRDNYDAGWADNMRKCYATFAEHHAVS